MLIDFVMPKLNGYQLAQALAVERLRTLPIVLMSAKADQIGERFIKSTGALDAITKPFAPEAIVTVVGHALSRRRAPDPRDAVPTRCTASRASRPSTRTDSTVSPSPGRHGRHRVARGERQGHGARYRRDRSARSGPGRGGAAIRRGDCARDRAGAARALADRRGVDERTIMDAITHGITPAELASIARELSSSHERELRGPVAIEGSLAMAPLGELLQLLRLQQQTGLLVVQRRMSSEVGIAFHQGHIDLAVARNVSSEFLLGRYLIAEGSITREALEQMLQQRGPRSGWLGEQLVTQGISPAKHWSAPSRGRPRKSSTRCCAGSEGRYRFEQGVVLPEAAARSSDCPSNRSCSRASVASTSGG